MMPSCRTAVASDAAPLASLLNAIIARGGTTAHETPLSPEGLAQTYFVGPSVICCHVAIDSDGAVLGFQMLVHSDRILPNWGDIATFAKIDTTQRGLGATLFAATRTCASQHGIAGISATIRADNAGGLRFYTRLGFDDHVIAHGVLLRDGTPVDRIIKRFVVV